MRLKGKLTFIQRLIFKLRGGSRVREGNQNEATQSVLKSKSSQVQNPIRGKQWPRKTKFDCEVSEINQIEMRVESFHCYDYVRW